MSTRDLFPTPRQARTLLVFSLALQLYGLISTLGGPKPVALILASPHSDVQMYRDVAQAVHAGEPYYAAAFRALSRGGYATRPFWNFRLPTLAYLAAAFPDPAQLRWLLQALAVSTIVLWVLALRRASVLLGLFAPLALLPTLIITLTPNGFWLHETWAGMLISASLALAALQRPILSVLAGFAAVGVRELSVLHAVVRSALALRERRARVFLAWGLALAMFAVLLAVHAWYASSFVLPGGQQSASWLAFGGYRFLLVATHLCSPLVIAPEWVTALVLPLCWYGLAAGFSEVTRQVGPVVLAYYAAWLFVGRADNQYWGHLMVPLLPLGLLQLPEALRRTSGRR